MDLNLEETQKSPTPKIEVSSCPRSLNSMDPAPHFFIKDSCFKKTSMLFLLPEVAVTLVPWPSHPKCFSKKGLPSVTGSQRWLGGNPKKTSPGGLLGISFRTEWWIFSKLPHL